MSYIGQVVPIPMGQGGLHTDDSPSAIPPTSYILANNVTVHANQIEKFPGAMPINATAIPMGVYGAWDFWPDTLIANRRLIVLGGDGKIYAIDNAGVVTEITPMGGAPATLTITNQVFFLTAGKESAVATKKLFIFTGSNPVQVISGTAAVRTNLALPPADWAATNQPSFGIVHQNRVFAGGNLNNPHTLYVSLATDHEDFTTAPVTLAVYPGEGEKLVGTIIYKGRLFNFKYPFGAYYLVDDTPVTTTWYYRKTEGGFGFASPHSVIPVLNDVLIKNASDSITSVLATRDFGDIQAGDVLTILRIEQYVRENTNAAAAPFTHCLYYPEKKLAMFTYRSPQGTSNDRLLIFRVDVVGKPKATFVNFLRPNCLTLRKDTTLIERPIVGSLDGFAYQMDQLTYNFNGISYTGEFQTPHMDFGFVEPKLAGMNKNFDFLELRYVPQGNWNIYAEIYIDGNLYETIAFPMIGDALLADVIPDPLDFMLSDSATDPTGSFLAGEDLLTVRKRLRGTGRTISVRLYNSGLNQTFKIATMIFSFRPSGEQQR